MVNPQLCRWIISVRLFRDTSVVARGRGASGQKASAGLALFWEASAGFRRMRRADRAIGRSALRLENAFRGVWMASPPDP